MQTMLREETDMTKALISWEDCNFCGNEQQAVALTDNGFLTYSFCCPCGAHNLKETDEGTRAAMLDAYEEEAQYYDEPV